MLFKGEWRLDESIISGKDSLKHQEKGWKLYTSCIFILFSESLRSQMCSLLFLWTHAYDGLFCVCYWFFINTFRENLSWNLSLNCITPGIMCSLPLPVAWGHYQPQNKWSFWGFQENHLFEFNLQKYLISSAYKISAKTSCWLLWFFFFSNSPFRWEYRHLGTRIYAGAS